MELIFDEILTGFRAGLRGAQDVFGVRPDLALFGKMIGNGMPIAAVAGSAEVLSHVDGGRKQLLSEGEELSTTTYLHGTFNKNGLSVLAMRDVLQQLSDSPDLISRAEARIQEMFTRFRVICPPDLTRLVLIRRYGSVFRFLTRRNEQAFLKYMIAYGVYIFEAGTCFMSPYHSDADLDSIARAMVATLKALVSEGLLSPTQDSYSETQVCFALRSPVSTAGTMHDVVMNEVQLAILKECLVNPNATPSYTIGFSLLIDTEEDGRILLERFQKLVDSHQVFHLRIPNTPIGWARWRFRKFLIEHPTFVVGIPPRPEDYRSVKASDLSTKQYFSQIAPLELNNTNGLFGCPLFKVENVRCADNGVVLNFGFHHILFDGESVSTIRSQLSDGGGSSDEDWLSFSELNRIRSADVTFLHDIKVDDILEFSIPKPIVEDAAIADTYKYYKSFEFKIAGEDVQDIKTRYFLSNTNMVAFLIFSTALGRYFERDKIVINCTEAGRNHSGEQLKGLGMLARYFPCCVSLPQRELSAETASSVVKLYWDGFNNDFSSYLSKVRRMEFDTKTLMYQFSYNYDGFEVHTEPTKLVRGSKSVYPRAGIFDIVVNVYLSGGIGDAGGMMPEITFKIDYTPTFIFKEKLEYAFNSCFAVAAHPSV